MQMSDLNTAIDKLAAADLLFLVSVPWVAGGREFRLTQEQVKRYMVDAPLVLAELCGVSRDVYLGYHRDNFTAYCCATTRDGKPCRKSVPGGTLLPEPEAWQALQGKYCTTHG
ncbi:hypothetical protein [Pandoraea anhela]|uniref:Uncharacterized protein n=1 Tax=Pandoraea anhela TaxID=2508295 RepID=A0A5E4Z855_9BURK|nr:hypothetical protein [Pandoraea anhela]VVE57481.1 hypothetical protein PAN31108_05205 [Pandoraea anhela]